MGAESRPKEACFKSNQGSAYSLLSCTAAPTSTERGVIPSIEVQQSVRQLCREKPKPPGKRIALK